MSSLPYFTYRDYLQKKYGDTLYSIPIDLDLSCPNRKKDGSGGCTFCPSNGARAAQTLQAKNVEEQIQKAISFSKQRYNAKRFMLYIQAYTGTFTSVINQRKMYEHLLKEYKFDAISIGTRPDCLTPETLMYLKELNTSIDVNIDLGVQTLNDTSLKRINRGHDSTCSLNAIKKLKNIGVSVFAHIIVGLENEKREDWINTTKKLVQANVDGIKIHNLHIIKNTQLATQFDKKPFKVYNEYEYANEVIEIIRHVPLNITIIRVSTDTLKNDLIAPLWRMQKGQFSEYVIETMRYRDVHQADLVNKTEINVSNEKIFKLKDGSISVWDKKYKDYYHPKSGAVFCARELFIKQSELIKRCKKDEVELLDIGFGLGYNTLEALKIKKNKKLKITALDKNRQILKTAMSIHKNSDKNIIKDLYDSQKYEDEFNHIHLIIDEARHTIFNLHKKYDVIFLDPFMCHLNPSLISKQFIKQVSRLLKEDGVMVCSTNSSQLKTALHDANLSFRCCDIEKTDVKGLCVTLHKEKQIETIPTKKAYEDPFLIYREKQIICSK